MSTLTATQKSALAKGQFRRLSHPTSRQSTSSGGFKDLSDVLLCTPSDLSRACKITPHEADKIISLIYRERAQPLHEFKPFTTGDSELDVILGGGIATSMTSHPVPPEKPNLPSSSPSSYSCRITSGAYRVLRATSPSPPISKHSDSSRFWTPTPFSPLPSARFRTSRPVQTPTIPRLIHVLSTFLPHYIDTASQNPTTKPLKLVVIDALAELFHDAGKTTTKTLVERARQLSEIASHLHVLASTYRIAVLVLNEVIDVIDRDAPLSSDAMSISYRDQSRLFGRADSIPGENRKEAALGLVWANQVNVRIFLTRTGRRRYLDRRETPKKHSAVGKVSTAHVAVTPVDDQPVLIRRLSVVFSSVAVPASCDYIITAEGISVIPGSTVSLAVSHAKANQHPITIASAGEREQREQVAPLDVGCVADSFAAENSKPTPENELGPIDDDTDEWDSFWAENTLPEDALTQIDSSSIPSSFKYMMRASSKHK
ncbi:P-loop containing nucleoside triphosphate hydrolase protein [Chiua virens]|nr:P-loop containing nucleoside triphosphate hydrolase protein [Chiua virens]